MIQPSIWVFGETVEDRPTNWTLELVSEARRLANQIGAAHVGVLTDGNAPTFELAERGADVVALFGPTPDRVNVDCRAACRQVLAQPGWSLVLIPQTARWLTRACEFVAQTSATLVESCERARVGHPGELELCRSRSEEPVIIRVPGERAIALAAEHSFRLGAPSATPIVDVRRVTA